jgi:dihydroorotase
MEHVEITQPDDWHLHVRDGAAMRDVVADSARQFGRAIIMPNLKPPVVTVADALAYRARILEALPKSSGFQPLMTVYLTDRTTVDDVRRVAESLEVHAFKLYPAGATTNSEAGVSQLQNLYPIFEAMERYDVPLLVHGEVTDADIDVFDREAVFIERHLNPLVERLPGLRVVLEHVTTREGTAFVRDSHSGVGGTLTAHHLLFNRNALLAGGIRPHYYCLPILKREIHRQALLEAATSGSPKFFLGTDSAPHSRHLKESSCGCAGCYTARAAIELYAAAFEAAGALDKLEGFASHHGADFYRLPRNPGTITLVKSPWRIPDQLPMGDSDMTPLMAGQNLSWRLSSPT